MKSFEITIKKETYNIIRSSSDNNDDLFCVFNYATCHVIKRNVSGKWEPVKHRFGTDELPLPEIGEAIDKHFDMVFQNEPSSKVKNKKQLSNED